MPPPDRTPSPVPALARLHIEVRGVVQGVGFRPFVHRLALELGLRGWVNNSPQGVSIEVEGRPERLRQFLLRLDTEKPPLSSIQSLESRWLDPVPYHNFEIRASSAIGGKTALVLPDIATCADCRREIFDPSNRRFQYPFTNCTHCGPRWSILHALPYDRVNTSMRQFAMCPRCQREYDNPRDRRFHAQPNACPDCGPRLELWAPAGTLLASRHGALLGAAQAIRDGRIVAVKGLGGFHLVVTALDEAAVRRLRERKHREEKPFALMFPSLEQVKAYCEVEAMEERLLLGPESPIVLLRRTDTARRQFQITSAVAPGNPYWGVMLPYTPLHHLLLHELDLPVVATSGNLSDEPICTDEREALSRLAGLADVFLIHDRPIVRHVDDSIVRVMLGRELVLRRARGYAPMPVRLGMAENAGAILGVGAHLKNTVALAVGPQVFLSQHIGDLENEPALDAFRRVVADLQRLYEVKATTVAADLHPDYLSTKFARASGLPVVAVQHHYAHVLACMAENDLQPPVLGVSWDGTGYGPDQTIWGGEFLKITPDSFERFARLRTFRLPGGERAVKEPRRTALGVLYEMLGDAAFDLAALPALKAFRPEEMGLLRQSLRQGINAPVTSSMGRLFDAVAGLAGLRQTMRFEGQAAMELEFALEGFNTAESYPLPVVERATSDATSTPSEEQNGHQADAALVVDWSELIRCLLADVEAGTPRGLISARFHNALAEAIVEVARQAGEARVVLSGGCFQNRYLTERAVQRLQDADFRPYWHQRVPPNDGGVALGQVAAAARALSTNMRPCV